MSEIREKTAIYEIEVSLSQKRKNGVHTQKGLETLHHIIIILCRDRVQVFGTELDARTSSFLVDVQRYFIFIKIHFYRKIAMNRSVTKT